MSDITINGSPFPDGAPLPINGVQAQKVTVNGQTVWVNSVPPSAIVDFAASDDQLGQVTMTFTPATGIPTPTHDLYADNVLVQAGISSGYIRSIAGPDTATYKVRAVNSTFTDSNEDIGHSAALQIIFENKTIRVSPNIVDFDFVGDGATGIRFDAGADGFPTDTGPVINTEYPIFGSSSTEASVGNPGFMEGIRLTMVANGMHVTRTIEAGDSTPSPVLVYTNGVGFESAVRKSGNVPTATLLNVSIEGGPLGFRFQVDNGTNFGWSDWMAISEVQTTP